METNPRMRRVRIGAALRALLGVALLPALLLAGCAGTGGGASPSPSDGSGGPSPSADPSAIQLPANPDAVVVLVRWEGGFVPPDARFVQLPQVAIYADGRVITQGAVPAIYPGPLVPPLFVARIPLERVRAILAAAADAGLTPAEPVAYPATSVADAPDTVFEIWSNGALARTSFGAFGIEQSGLSAAETAARARAEAFTRIVPSWGTADGATQEGPYEPSALRLVVRPYANPSPDLPQTPVDWPIATDLASGGVPVLEGSPESGRCLVVTDGDVTTLLPVLGAANALTPFVSGGREYAVGVRPLLPHEEPICP